MNNKPLFTIEVLIPEHLDLTLAELNQLDDTIVNSIIDEMREHIISLIIEKNHPFLLGNMSEKQIINTLKKLNQESTLRLIHTEITDGQNGVNISDGGIMYNSTASKAVNLWFPEMEFVKRNNGRSVGDQFFNKEEFNKNVKAIINGRFKYLQNNPNMRISKALKAGLRLINGNQPIYNFSPNLAKDIYFDYFSRHTEITDEFYIFDPFLGFGGRLAGALALCANPNLKDIIVHYHGTDVNSSIADRYKMLYSFWKENINPELSLDLYTALHPIEEILTEPFFSKKKGCYDIAMSSPPYFLTEQYSTDKEQSYLRYPEYDLGGNNSWTKGFLEPMLLNIHSLLKVGGEAWVNIANISNNSNLGKFSKINLEHDTVYLAKKLGFKYKKRYSLLMPLLMNLKVKPFKNNTNSIIINGKAYKQEPMLVFEK